MTLDLDAARIPEGCLSDFSLDRLLAGELDGTAEGARAVAHLKACDACSARVRAFDAENAAFPAEVWVQGLAFEARRRAGRERASAPEAPRKRVMRTAVALAMAASIAAVAIGIRPPASEDGVRIKGGGLSVLVNRGGRAEVVLPGDRLRAGDQIRFEVSSASDGYAVILGADATPAVSVFSPVVPIHAGRQVLDGGVMLDDARGSERVIALICEQPIDAGAAEAAVRGALQRAGGDPSALGAIAVASCRVHSVLLWKE